MEQDSVSSLPGNNSPPMDFSNVVAVAGNISSLMSILGISKRREHSYFMDTEEVDTSSTPKLQKYEHEGKMVQVKKRSMKGKKKQEQPKVTGLELQEYVSDGLTTNKYSSKEEWSLEEIWGLKCVLSENVPAISSYELEFNNQ